MFGIIDLASIPKDRYYLYRSVCNKNAETLHILPHWSWPGREGEVTPVFVTLPENSIERIIFWFTTLKSEQEKFAGIGGLKSYEFSGDVGESFEGEYLDCSSIERREKNIKGDKAEVFYTDVIKKYRFPEFSGEKFLSE